MSIGQSFFGVILQKTYIGLDKWDEIQIMQGFIVIGRQTPESAIAQLAERVRRRRINRLGWAGTE
jgi:hypothetical protein